MIDLTNKIFDRLMVIEKSGQYLTYNNETHTMMEWSEIRKINYYTLRSRIRNGWNIGRALNYE